MEIAATFDEISAVSALSEAERSPTQKTLGKDDFLSLMVTQLANQNPLEPMDNDEYITQMATFTQLELLQNMNSNLERSLNWSLLLSQTINNTMATSLLGREVQVSTDSVVIDESGTSKIRYDLETAAEDVVIQITSTDGTLVRVLRENGANSGAHEILWDGLDANGAQMPKGSYTIQVTATDSEDNEVAARAYFNGVVDAVRYIEGQAYLSVDEVLIPLSEIMQVSVADDEG
jgi:flagellar basal-body rod modification protein FlgD